MVSERLLNIIMLIEVALLALAVSLFFLHGVWLHLTARRMDRLSKTGRESLARLVMRGIVNVEDIEVLKNLPPDVQNITAMLRRALRNSQTGTGMMYEVTMKMMKSSVYGIWKIRSCHTATSPGSWLNIPK